MGIWINYLLIQSILEIWLWWVSAAMLCWPLRWRAIAGGREIYNGKYNDYHSTALWLDWGLPESLQTSELRWGRAIRTFVISYHSRPCQTQWHSPQSEKNAFIRIIYVGKEKKNWLASICKFISTRHEPCICTVAPLTWNATENDWYWWCWIGNFFPLYYNMIIVNEAENENKKKFGAVCVLHLHIEEALEAQNAFFINQSMYALTGIGTAKNMSWKCGAEPKMNLQNLRKENNENKKYMWVAWKMCATKK